MAAMKTAAVGGLALSLLVLVTIALQWYFYTYKKEDAALPAEITHKADQNPPPPPPSASKRCLISYVMWGNRSLDFHGAIRHAESVPYMYPGCKMVLFYDDKTVDSWLIGQLVAKNVSVIPFNHKMLIDMGWNTTVNAFRVVRYWALNLPDWDYIMFRDLDSGIYFREKTAVEEWLLSGMPFHFMRDHPGHWWAIMGGLWGLTNAGLKIFPFNFTELLKTFVVERLNVTTTEWSKWTDQKFLEENIFPIAKKYAMAHDTYYCLQERLQSKILIGFPTQRPTNPRIVAGHFTLEDGTPIMIDSEIPETPVECRRHKHWVYG